MDRNICVIIFVVFIAYTARDLFFKSMDRSQVDALENVKKEIPSMSFKSAQSGPTITILYCYSCGYQRAFEEYRKIILENFPGLNVIGNNYNPSFIKSKLAQFISITKMIAIVLLVANFNPFAYFGMQTPYFWEWMRDHKVMTLKNEENFHFKKFCIVLPIIIIKLYACLMTFFLSNTLESQLMSSGAFEIYYNDLPVWSKLATGRIPSPTELLDMIGNQHKFSQTEMFSETIPTMSGRSL